MSLAQLRDETGIVWLRNPDGLRYVRSSSVPSVSKTTEPNPPVGKLVGYTTLDDDAEPTHYNYTTPQYYRRVFWLKPHDWGEPENNGVYETRAPDESVDPDTIDVGVEGRKTTTSEGRPVLHGGENGGDDE